MVLPHHLARFVEGNIVLSDEYAEYAWVAMGELQAFESKITNIPEIVAKLQRLATAASDNDWVEI